MKRLVGYSTVLASMLCLLPGCADRKAGGSGSGGGTMGEDSDSSTEGVPDGSVGIPITINKDVDILFVIDNSGSMGEEQATLAANAGAFLELLEEPDVAANYRIGFTTTDDGNPWCQGTGPEAGNLRLTSCRSRADEFVFPGAGTEDFTFQEACLDLCSERWETIDIQPSSSERDGQRAVRPWLENIDGLTNLPDDLSMAEAFACLAPQGVNGCGFESPLESMWKTLRRSETEGEPGYGFIRDTAALAIIHLTDEADCSYNRDWETIFLPDGNRVFWSDANASTPTSAVCWNAGVACVGSGTYDDCVAVNLDENGNEVFGAEADDLAVMRPISRYIDFVQEFENVKQQTTPDQQVLVSVIGGVGSDGVAVYQDALGDPEFQADFGIGPGCQSTAGTAVPPVRLREFAEAFAVGSEQNMFSVCDGDYSPAMRAVAAAIADQALPACLPACVADVDPSSSQLDPSCQLRQESPRQDGSFEEIAIPPCNPDGSLPSDVDACFVALVDDGSAAKATPDANDDMSGFCVDQGWNLEFRITRRPGVPAASGTAVLAFCELSQSRLVDCPSLP